MLATKAVLQGVGVGNESATAASAVVTWLLRDGAGMVGRILFTWLKGVTAEIALMCVLIGDTTRGEPNIHNLPHLQALTLTTT